MIKAVLFDLDMTLIDFMKMKRKASDAAAKAMVKAGLNMDVKKARKKLFDEYIQDIEGEHVFQDFLKEHNSLNDRILAAALNSYIQTKYRYMKPYPKVKQTLNRLKAKGLKLGIVTDAPRLKAFQRLDAMGIADMFDAVVGIEDTGRRKPSKLPFRKALKELGIKPEESLYVGDWPDRDILGAKKMGIATCFARYGYLGQGKPVWADCKITSFEEIEEIVMKKV